MKNIFFKYKSKIQALNPLDESNFLYDASRWSMLNDSAKKLVTEYEGNNISRRDIIRAFKDYYDGKISCLYPFTLTMIWGFANVGYGTYRTNIYLSTEENRRAIELAFNTLELNDVYNSLLQIDKLNVSYASKLLYFASRAREEKQYALIFDIRVARALVEIMDPYGIGEVLNIMPSNKFNDYERYISFMHDRAGELKVEAESLELFLFNGDF